MKPRSINTVSTPVVTPINAKVQKLGISFRAFAKKSAKCVLGMAETVTKAKRLSAAEFINFCNLVGLDPTSSRIRKLIVIGNNLDRLKKHLKVLPPNWTTIYEIAQMDDDLIDRLVRGGILTPTATAASLSPQTPPARPKQSRASSAVPNGTQSSGRVDDFLQLDGSEVVAHFDDWLDAEKLQVLTTACDSLRSIGAEIQFGEIIEEMIDCAVDDGDDSRTLEVEHACV